VSYAKHCTPGLLSIHTGASIPEIQILQTQLSNLAVRQQQTVLFTACLKTLFNLELPDEDVTLAETTHSVHWRHPSSQSPLLAGRHIGLGHIHDGCCTCRHSKARQRYVISFRSDMYEATQDMFTLDGCRLVSLRRGECALCPPSSLVRLSESFDLCRRLRCVKWKPYRARVRRR
jgi:hypothetical protein